MIVVTQLPFVATLVISLFDWNALYPDARRFAGLANYGEVLTEPELRNSVLTTILLTVTVVLVSLVLGLGLALLLDRRFRGRGLVRTLLIAPFLLVPVAAALLWKHVLYNPEYGLLNGLLHLVGGPQPDWISSTPLLAIEASLVWQWTPFMMLILLAGLQSRSHDVLEAARMERRQGSRRRGAGPDARAARGRRRGRRLRAVRHRSAHPAGRVRTHPAGHTGPRVRGRGGGPRQRGHRTGRRRPGGRRSFAVLLRVPPLP
jgi:hypothetical protein